MLVGGIMTAALATPNANPFGADNMFGYMNDKQIVWLSVIAFIFLYQWTIRKLEERRAKKLAEKSRQAQKA